MIQETAGSLSLHRVVLELALRIATACPLAVKRRARLRPAGSALKYSSMLQP